jgi:hypothetical protein
MPPMVSEPKQDEVRKHPLIVLLLCGTVILGALLTVIYVTVTKQPQSRMTYTVVVALACFIASSISGLLFATTNVQMRGTLGIFALSVGGPAALWLVALVVVTRILPPDVPETDVLRITQQVVTDQEKRDGWIPFKNTQQADKKENWLTALKDLSDVFEKDEEANLRQLLSGTFIKGDGHSKFSGPVIQSLFLYPKDDSENCRDRTIKLQHIKGLHKTQTAEIFIANSPTMPGGRVSAVVLTRDGTGHVAATLAPRQPTWQPNTSNPSDFFMISNYCDPIASGDWLEVHVPKYIDDAQGATVDIGIAADRSISYNDTAMWEVRTSMFNDGSSFPVLFKRLSNNARRDFDTFDDDYQQWLGEVEKEADRNRDSDAGKLLNELRPYLARKSNSGKLAFVLAPHTAAFRSENTRYTNVMTFLWKETAL